jgi:hypothetical protein
MNPFVYGHLPLLDPAGRLWSGRGDEASTDQIAIPSCSRAGCVACQKSEPIDKFALPKSQYNPTCSSWVDTIEGSGEGDGFADVVEAAEPRYYSLYAHAEAGVGDAAVFA